MAEEGAVRDLERLVQQLQALFGRHSSDTLRAQSEPFCSEFFTLIEEHACRWQTPLPQLRILEIALCYFAQASTVLPSSCDHVIHTLSSLALSIFELLLFFDQKDFNQEPLKQFTVTFQECHSSFAKHQNIHLLQLERLLQGGGVWAFPALQAILSDASLPQNEVDGCITSEPPVFFELRVRYLLSCKRIKEATALSRCCAQHPTAGRHSFFLQVYLTSLYKTSQLELLLAEVSGFNGKDAVNIICALEFEESDELLLSLSRVFLSEQLRRGDVHQLGDLVLMWTKLHNRLNTPKPPFLEESRKLMSSATNVCSIFPFIRAILQEMGEDGIQFCVELCANALQSFPDSDVTTKSLIYKTIAALVPNDLEVCRACALLVFFLERSVDSYKTVYLLYMLPDQQYHVDSSSIGNQVRFETLQILKKDLYFDPEFWNLIALRTNCLNLMREREVSIALDEIMEDKWIAKYCTKDSALRQICKERKDGSKAAALKRPIKSDAVNPPKRFKVGLGRPRINVDYTGKKKGNQRSQMLQEASSVPLRRSFWQLDRIQDREHGRITRLSEKTLKRRIRKPRWLLEDSGLLDEKRLKKHLRCRKHLQSSVMNRQESGELKNDIKQKTSVNSDMKAKEITNTKHKRASVDSQRDRTPQVILELSLPDNELFGTFTDESCHRQRGFPQMLLYKPTEKLPDSPQPVKTAHRKEVILRARDLNMFVQQLHCYIRRPKGKDTGSHVHRSVSTITRSSVQGNPSQDAPKTKARREKSTIQLRVKVSPQKTEVVTDKEILHIKARESVSEELSEKSVETQASDVLKSNATGGEIFEEPAVEMKVTIASPILDKVSKAEVLPSLTAEVNLKQAGEKIPPICDQIYAACDTEPSPTQQVSPKKREEQSKSLSGDDKQEEICKEVSNFVSDAVDRNISQKDSFPDASLTSKDQMASEDMSSLTAVTELVTKLVPEQLNRDLENVEERFLGNGAFKDLNEKWKHESLSQNEQPTSTCVESQTEVIQKDVKDNAETKQDVGLDPFEDDDDFGEDEPESEESKLEFCCTFCNKNFKGCRVVKHAMCHYRRDECMFCGTMFKDDLLAMMHLSNHIETLKKIIKKETVSNDAKGKASPQTKEMPLSEPLVSSERRKRGRPRKIANCLKSSQSVISVESRKLRSYKEEDGSSSQEQSRSGRTPIHKLNGHIRKKKEMKKLRSGLKVKATLAQQDSRNESKRSDLVNHRLVEHQSNSTDSSATSHQVDKRLPGSVEENKKTVKAPQRLKMVAKQKRKLKEKPNAPKERVCCPMNGCQWFTDLSKNRVALLYHALDEHSGQVKPLELAFRIAKSRCSICMRVLWSFEHFQHHIEQHRRTPRYPCLHQGCTARFKTGNEMRRHTRKHSPLQAVCCVPGCPKLFICLWALNLHERDHYSKKSSKTNKNSHQQKDYKCDPKQNQTVKDSKDRTDEARTAKAESDQKEQMMHQSTKVKQVEVPSLSASKSKNRPNFRLRGTLRSLTNDVLPNIPNQIRPPLLFLRGRRARHKLKKKQPKVNTKEPKKRGRPRKIIFSDHVEHTTTTVREKTTLSKDQTNHVQLPQSDAEVCRKKVGKCEQIKQGGKTVENQPSGQKTKKPVGKKDKNVPGKGKTKSFSPSSADRPLTNKSDTTTQKAKAANLTNCSSASVILKRANDKVKKQKIKKHQSSKISGVDQAEANATAPSSIKGSTEVEHKASDNVKNGHFQKGQESTLNRLHEKDKQKEDKGEKDATLSTGGQEKEESQTPACESSIPAASYDLNAKTELTTTCLNAAKQEPSKKSSHMKKNKLKEDAKQERKIKKRPKNNSNPSANKKPSENNSAVQPISDGKSVTTENSALKKKHKENPKQEKKIKKRPKNNSDPSAIRKPTETDSGAQPISEGKTETTDCCAVKKKHKKNPKEDIKIKKWSTDKDNPSAIKTPLETESQVQPIGEDKAEAADSSVDTIETVAVTNEPVLINGVTPYVTQASLCMDVLEEYNKKPYRRLPPTAYLAEMYTTMPKRRKELSWFSPRPKSSPPSQQRTSSALQRQRCATCFTTFTSTEELQSHLQTQRCSKLFGFDSDED
ncbi:uncharacterized protein LOC114477142 isoform X2 [Gouania willdenowi]|uniref:uncharacterized protein LOC114477142 isoform X2 n=1 Tax=Gouania willdenowi TaxID=441366 RepID=UPI0010565282|nr:uncharacterized protein LOC114477142 isoform X2 [Gouania willdenowi]